MSAPVYPDWTKLVNGLCRSCGISARVVQSSPVSAFLNAAEDARRADIDRYHAYLGIVFRRSPRSSEFYSTLLRIPFKSYITVNFDSLLAHENRKPEQRCAPLMAYPNILDRAAINSRAIYYIHGLIGPDEPPRPGSVVLSKSEFAKAYHEHGLLRAFLIQTLTYDPICFFGCQLREPALHQLFAICNQHQAELLELARGSRPPRYILLPTASRRESCAQMTERKKEDERYEAIGIKVVRYDPIDKGHIGLLNLLEPIAGLDKIRVCALGKGALYGTQE
jgi:hypothetical protein